LNEQSYDSFIALLSNSSQNCNFDDQKDIISYYDTLLKMRHDIFHFALSKALYGVFKKEKRIDQIFPDFKASTAGLTPDIVHITPTEVCIMDVSFSKDKKQSFQDKMDKYELLRTQLSEHVNKICLIYPICLDGSLNVKYAFENVKKFFAKPLDVQFINVSMTIYYNKVELINKYCDASLLDEHRKNNYNRTFDKPILGLVEDFDFDKDEMDNISFQKYPHHKKCKIDIPNFLDHIKRDLDSEGPLYSKYKDSLNKCEFYDQAFTQIEDLNKQFEIKIRPTLPILLPEKEDIKNLPILSGTFSEQTMLGNFVDKFCLLGLNDDNKIYTFINLLFREYYSVQQNKRYNHCFNTGYYFDKDEEDKHKKEYLSKVNITKTKRTKKNKSMPTQSYHDYLIEKNLLEERKLFPINVKTMAFTPQLCTPNFKEGWLKSV